MSLGKLSLFGTALAFMFACGTAQAQLRAPVINVNSEFGIAAQGFFQSYSEVIVPGPSDSEHGAIPGMQIKATSMFDAFGVENLYAGLRYEFDGGGMAYDGAFLNGTPVNGTTHYAINDAGLEFGKGFLLADNVLITPLVEGGWRGWKRDLSSFQTENYKHYYVGAGVRGDLGITDRLVVTGKLGIAETLDPVMTSEASPALGLPLMKFSLGSAPLYQASLGADYKFYTMLHLYGGVDLTRFSYGASAVNEYGFLEPSSNTNEVVFRLGLAVGL